MVRDETRRTRGTAKPPPCACGSCPALDGPIPGAPPRVFAISGLDCADEAQALRRTVGSVAGGPDRLAFDLLEGTLTVRAPEHTVSDETVLRAIAAAGFEGRPAAASPTRPPPWYRNPLVSGTVGSGLLLAAGVLVQAVLAGDPLAAVGFRHDAVSPPLATVILHALAIAVGVGAVAPRALAALRTLRPDMNLLMTVAVAGAAALGQWLEGATVAFLFALSLLLESWSVSRARRAVRALMALAPPTVRIVRDGVETTIDPADAAPGDRVLVFTGERIPLDGETVRGPALVDASPVTGESRPVAVTAGTEVFAGSIVVGGTLEFRVSRPAEDTLLARIVRQVAEASRRRARVERWIDRFARRYTPAVLGLAVLTAAVPPLLGAGPFADWFYRALVLLVIGCPCALVIATPVAVVAALAAAARHGVLLKGGDILEVPARLAVVAFDKTGTLTTGGPAVVAVVPAPGHTRDEVLALAAALECRSVHPLAVAIVRASTERGAAPSPAEEVETVPGLGITGTVGKRRAWAGSPAFARRAGADVRTLDRLATSPAREGRTVVAVGYGTSLAGIIALADGLRPDAADTVRDLRREGVGSVVMLTGDTLETAREIARRTGIEEVHAELLPADKARIVAELRERGPVAFVGDGINDAPALAAADIGIAMGAGTDVALETAHAALVSGHLHRIPWLIRHARRTVSVVRANIGFALGVKAAFAVLALAGFASLWAAIAADTGASLLVIANALRLLRARKTSLETAPLERGAVPST